MGGGAWWAAVHGVPRSRTRLSDFTFTFHFMHWRRNWKPAPVFLPGESQGRGSLVGCRLWGRTESDTTEATWQQQQHFLNDQFFPPQTDLFFFFVSRVLRSNYYLVWHSKIFSKIKMSNHSAVLLMACVSMNICSVSHTKKWYLVKFRYYQGLRYAVKKN